MPMSNSYWRINPIAMISAAAVLISLFLPWWGVYEPVAFGTLVHRWTLWSPPGTAMLHNLGYRITLSAASTAQTFAYASLAILLLALVVASLALAGSLTMHRSYLIAGLALAILTPIAYIFSISYVTSNFCLNPLPSTCASVMGRASFGGSVASWGFETGFYAFIAAALVLAVGLSLNNSLARTIAVRRAEVTVAVGQPAK
jgi:hypothetical protein